MRSMLKKIAGMVASVLALSLLAASPASATVGGLSEKLTASEYSAYLAGVAPNTLAAFEALTPAEQDQYLALLSNPALYTDDAQDLDGVDVGGSSVDRTPIATRATTVDRNVWSTRWVSILGINVIEYKTEVGYRVTSGKVTKIISSSAIVGRNLNPLVQTGLSSKSAWVASGGGSARLTATFYYNVGPIKGLSSQIMTLNASLTGYTDGGVSYSWYGS